MSAHDSSDRLRPVRGTGSASLVAAAGLALACGAAMPAAAQTALDNVDHARGVVSANEAALIKAQVVRVVETYYEHFSSGAVERIPEETHLIPYIVLGGGVTMTAEAAASGYAERRQMVVDTFDRDYATSTYTVTNVCVLSTGSAITSGYNTRTRSDGGIVSVEGVAYFLTKAPQGWRIAAFSATTPELVIRCEEG